MKVLKNGLNSIKNVNNFLKKVGQKLFRAFLRNDDKSIKMIELTDEELYLYEIDDNQLIKPKDIVIPYIKLSI
jgi:CRISPR/Cas system-associated protein Cas10 (large subunit of type III CRISPR-Cas system)